MRLRFGILLGFLLLASCDKAVLIPTQGETTILRATCEMNNFEGFPNKVTGIVTIQLKSFLTIKIDNDDGSESVEITFPKTKCGVK